MLKASYSVGWTTTSPALLKSRPLLTSLYDALVVFRVSKETSGNLDLWPGNHARPDPTPKSVRKYICYVGFFQWCLLDKLIIHMHIDIISLITHGDIGVHQCSPTPISWPILGPILYQTQLKNSPSAVVQKWLSVLTCFSCLTRMFDD